MISGQPNHTPVIQQGTPVIQQGAPTTINPYAAVPQGVPLSYVIHRLVEQSYANLIQLSESLVDKSDEDRKKSLVKYLEGSRERFIRLLVLVKWAHYLPNLTNAANIINFLNQQDFYLRDAADSLCHLHTRLFTARAPGYDIPTAIDVLTTGSYQRLPTVLKHASKSAPLSDVEVANTIQRLDDLLCFRLLSSSVPKQFTSVAVSNGRVILTVNDEYTAHLTVNGEEMNDPWQVLSLHLLLRPHSHKNGNTSTTPAAMNGVETTSSEKDDDGVLPAIHVRRVVDVVNLRMAESAAPLQELHTIVHHLVVTLMMDILRTQAQTLKIMAPPQPLPPSLPNALPPPLVVNYWNDNPTHPSLKIRVDTTSANIVVDHNPVIVDPLTNSEPQFKIVPTSLSIENLLMQAVRHHARSRIYTLAQRMTSQPMLAQCVDTSDRDYVAVTLFGGWRLVIGVDYVTGRFVARDSSLPADVIPTLEESFNTDMGTIPELASQLRIRAAINYVERITHAIPLEAFKTLPIYTQNQTSTPIPTPNNYNTLYLRYPAIETSVHYHLCVTIAPDLIPTFTLLRVNASPHNLQNSHLPQTPLQSYPIPIAVKQPITERTYDKAVGGAVTIGVQRRAYLMIVSELSSIGFSHQISAKKQKGNKQESEVVIQVTLPDPLPYPPVLLPALPRTPPFTAFSLTPLYSIQDHPDLPSPSHMGWQISATETQTKLKPSVNTADTKVLLLGKGYGDISCVNGSWTFTYSILGASETNGTRSVSVNNTSMRGVNNSKEANSNALRLFVQDMHGVAAIRELHSAIEKIVSGSDLADFFHIHAVGPTSIHIKCQGAGFPECTASIEWKGAAGITVDFSPTNNPFSPFLQRILTSSPAASASPYQPIVSFLLHVRHSLELVHHVSYYLDHPAIPLLPGDIVIIPRSGNVMRMVYRSTYGVDFRISFAGIQLEDAGEHSPNYNGLSGTSRERIPQQKLTNFPSFMEEKKALLGNPILPHSLPVVLRALHSYMGILWLWRASGRIFTELSDSPAAASATTPILHSNVKSDVITQQNKLAVKVVMHGIQYTFMVLHYEAYELYPSPLTPPSSVSGSGSGGAHRPFGDMPSNSYGLTASEAEAISQFWRQHVAAPPFRPSALISFIRILALPIVPLKEFAELMAMSQRPRNERDTEQVTLCLAHTVGSKQHEAVVHVATLGEIAFILRFIPSNAHASPPPPPPPPPSLSTSLALSSASVRPPEAHSTTTEIGLCYKYATHNLRVWSGMCGSLEQDAKDEEMLQRAIARARKVENESLPAIVRALLFERNPTAT